MDRTPANYRNCPLYFNVIKAGLSSIEVNNDLAVPTGENGGQC